MSNNTGKTRLYFREYFGDEEYRHELFLIINKERARDIISALESAFPDGKNCASPRTRVAIGMGGFFEALREDGSYEPVDLIRMARKGDEV
uniref:Uncharacterized protein n=1 Tax=viral metagenome TaxID=1070528 RepID=A0A6M3IGN6_9ZZZZ